MANFLSYSPIVTSVGTKVVEIIVLKLIGIELFRKICYRLGVFTKTVPSVTISDLLLNLCTLLSDHDNP